MAEFIRGSALPGPRVKTEVVRVKGTETQTFTIVSEQIFGIDIHWQAGRSHECTLEKGACTGCEGAWAKKWKGYLHVVPWHDKDHPAFLELTASAVERLAIFVPTGKTLRGLIVQIGKSKGGVRGRYIVQVLERRMADEELPAEIDPYPTLQFLWKCKKIK